MSWMGQLFNIPYVHYFAAWHYKGVNGDIKTDCIITNVVIYRKKKNNKKNIIIKILPQRQAHVHRCLIWLLRPRRAHESPSQGCETLRDTRKLSVIGTVEDVRTSSLITKPMQASVAHKKVPLHIYRMTMPLRSKNTSVIHPFHCLLHEVLACSHKGLGPWEQRCQTGICY